jgi:DNA invertase Pin-like site-specific DNA recombinase
MTKDEAIKFWGGPTRLAKALGITRDAVYKWKKYPPIDKQFQIMVLSGGRLVVTNDNTTKDKKND